MTVGIRNEVKYDLGQAGHSRLGSWDWIQGHNDMVVARAANRGDGSTIGNGFECDWNRLSGKKNSACTDITILELPQELLCKEIDSRFLSNLGRVSEVKITEHFLRSVLSHGEGVEGGRNQWKCLDTEEVH
ncbi:hypothetical protein B0H16DRAFT_1446430 [Mycena metata]|uniref:Uncharacterized protein n=1 Tax=Mycena metata TaxID=1033252 RepID=A0AAD7P1P4_9AGAR|nr:hypothetical protein B0H16DRAFT_1446430 [Mycena metata]